MARVITITSGKGGVGKTSISLNLSLSLASRGFNVCLFDADLGLANVNILTGIYPEKDLACVIDGTSNIYDIMIRDYQGVDIIPGRSGIQHLANLTPKQIRSLINAFLDLDDYDYFIFDTSAGLSAQVLSFCMASNEIILVATCEPPSITDAYSMLKVLSRWGYSNPVKVLINQVTTAGAAKKAYAQLKETVTRFLSIKLEPLGVVGWDKSVKVAVVSQTPFFMLFPDCLASRCLKTLTDKLMQKAEFAGDMPLELFWDRCLALFETEQARQVETPGKSQAAKGTDKTGSVQPQHTSHQNDSETRKALARIESMLSSLTEQVGQIKMALDIKDKKTAGEDPAMFFARTILPEPEEIILDFESWLHRNKRQVH